jgi:REP element-mobilizing transposase RayT
MDQPPYVMDERCRQAVLTALRERCADRQWRLLAGHVRTTHVHLVVEAEVRPERMMNDRKSSASRCLNQLRLDHRFRKRWARVPAAIWYVVAGQGNPVAVSDSLDG